MRRVGDEINTDKMILEIIREGNRSEDQSSWDENFMEAMKTEFCSEERKKRVADVPDVIGTSIRLDFMSILR